MEAAISIRQPWAWLLLARIKTVENRTWRLPSKYVEVPIFLHVGLQQDPLSPVQQYLKGYVPLRGGVVGIITFGEPERDYPSSWAIPGHWHWPVLDVRPVKFFPCPGRLKIFQIRTEENEQTRASLSLS